MQVWVQCVRDGAQESACLTVLLGMFGLGELDYPLSDKAIDNFSSFQMKSTGQKRMRPLLQMPRI